MYALVDANNFYVSCERLFRPELNTRPVVVLSNNDGCAISRSNEAKALGIKMGVPYFQIKALVAQHHIAIFSSNYTLYADISARIMNNLARFSPEVEVYSIDECFLGLTGISNLPNYAQTLRSTVVRNTGIPVSVGIAHTKTLAKLANKLAKKSPSGICVLQSEEEITNALTNFPIGDLWGIGRAYHKKLALENVFTAAQLRAQAPAWIKHMLTIQGLRLYHELWGRPCIPLKEVLDRKQGICTSRSFGKLTNNLEELIEATTAYTSRLAEKLRADKSCATLLHVQLLTNRFRHDLPQYNPYISLPLAHPISNTPDLIKAAISGVKALYSPRYQYSKVMVMATGLIPEQEVQLHLFSPWNGPKNNAVSTLMDKLNTHYGSGTIRMASEGYKKYWAMKRENVSPNYTTAWDDILRVG
jgi:DNA polymerase V